MNNEKITRDFNVADLRSDFPILDMQVYGKPLVYLDNAASAQKPKSVIASMTDLFQTKYANVHRGLHYLSNESTQLFEDARRNVQTYLNAQHDSEIVFTGGATDAINLVASSFVEPDIKPGDEIILSVFEHHSNIVPWHFLRERFGAVLKWIPMQEDGALDMAAYKEAFSERTKFVSISQMSNALGTPLPSKDIIDFAHQKGVPVLLDGCQGAVHDVTDMQYLDCDFYVFSGHKVYGPTGVGVLYAKKKHMEAMRPYRGGGEMIREVHEDRVTYADAPHKFEAGTPAIAEVIGLGAAIDYILEFDRALLHAHEQACGKVARDLISNIDGVKVHGLKCESAIVSFSVDGVHPHDIAMVLDRSGIAVRAGHHCAQPLMRRLNVAATARASFAVYNTIEEAEQFAQALDKAIKFFK